MSSALLGALTNAINGWVSPAYFRRVLRWDFDGIWAAAVAQGIFEGLLYGVVFALVLTVLAGVFTKGSARFSLLMKYLVGIWLGALVAWVFGGVAGITLAALSADRFRAMVYTAPEDPALLLPFAWVGGSIQGVVLGGVLAVGVGVVLLRAEFAKQATSQPAEG
ncbi:MAG: hypothetical protein KTR31_32390 [Myxococcales bacterium]|nr:hypothetical protein [Myxococcales bacterium]